MKLKFKPLKVGDDNKYVSPASISSKHFYHLIFDAQRYEELA